jgi:hypothetical protein
MQRVITRADVVRVAKRADEAGGPASFGLEASGAIANGGAPDNKKGLVADEYWTRLQKLIPAEVVAAFLAIDGVVQAKVGISVGVYWGIYVVLVVMCVLYAKHTASTPALGTDYRQVAIATVAFLIWTYAIGGPFAFAGVSWWIRAFGGVLVVLWTTAAPLFTHK